MSVTLAQMIADARAAVGEIPPADVREGIESGAIGLVLDVREPHEFADVRVEGSLLVPMSQLNTRLDDIPRDRPILVMCQVGGRSARVTGFLRQQGFEDVGNVAGGIDAWQRAGLPVRRGTPEPGEGEPGG
jgi:rhodanese-related sulfurtransferase